MDYIEIKAPAKINFGLFIISKREDGYHNIETVFYPLKDLYDTLIFKRSDHFSFTTDKGELDNSNNLVVKAKELLEHESGKKFNFDIELHKVIPIGAGLGGGSSDAAATLLSLNEMFALNYKLERLEQFALQLGSDVPFFIRCKPSYGESRGEKLSIIDLEINNPILLVNPGIHVSTKEAYGNIIPGSSTYNLKKLRNDILNSSDLSRIKNDFEEYVFKAYPQIAEIKNKLLEAGAMFVLMSGSGSTVFGIFNSVEEAERIKNSFPKSYFCFINN